ncbi:multiple ankyrin repeats single kh domain-containing protein [Rutstroemia sp. NJR-2017a BVV2]|nr:multiple ankyrin repeats single kh domain-containing protein [Rutstroemia sp. NJR-2017a BVV2]
MHISILRAEQSEKMSLKRSGTRKVTGGVSNRAKTYDVIQQELEVIYPGERNSVTSNIDIVFVPGLGAHPHESWKSTKTGWNWMKSADGLQGSFPKARILLYKYQSAWQGPLKVSQFLDNISKVLLVALRSGREDCKKRPIVFIGHSMGGLVIAKAITILNAQQESFPLMLEAISAAIFFGTPFAGAPVAACAAMYAYWAAKHHKATTSKLLEIMEPGNEALRELKDEFRRVSAKTRNKIELLCFWEEQPTDFCQMAALPAVFGLAKRLIPKELSEFVSKTSATFEGDVPNYGLASNHRDLVKFDSARDGRWNLVENILKKAIHGAYLTAKNRINSARDIELIDFKGIMEALDSARLHPGHLRKIMIRNSGKSTLISKEHDYIGWVDQGGLERRSSYTVKVDGLWVRGAEGRGKTGVMLSVLDDLENLTEATELANEDSILFAYFMCDTATDYCNAEDCLKSIIWQLVAREKSLASFAKDFVKVKEKGKNKARTTPTVENLWKALQGMLADEFTGSRVYIVLSNLHLLPEHLDSTVKLLNLLKLELEGRQAEDPGRVMVKWFITSRATYTIQAALNVERLRVINLEDEKFSNQFQNTLRKHAKSKVEKLEIEKKYKKALAWFIRSLIGERAQNTSWIDITCLQLEELPEAESELRVRRMLEAMPQELNALLKNAWLQIFRTAGEYGENVKEMLRALILTVEEPTETEFAVLCGQDGSDQDRQDLRQSIEKCKPLISVNRTVCFMNSAAKQHLISNANDLLGLSTQEIARQHGLLALRSFSYLKEKLDFPENVAPSLHSVDTNEEGSGSDTTDSDDEDSDEETDSEEEEEASVDDDDSSDNDHDWDEDSEPDPDPEAEELEKMGVLPYMVKNWLKHGSKATIGFADDLSLDEEFWKSGSLIRRRWLVEYKRNTKDFEYEVLGEMNAVQIVAAIGFRQLLIALIENGHKDELDGYEISDNTPLCFACAFGNSDMVEELLDRDVKINTGEEEEDDTPLHFAAEKGHIEASLNAYSKYSGYVINSAISSGNFAAVEVLVQNGVSLSIDRDDVETPLEQAASLSDVSMLEYLMEKYADQLAPEEYSKAFIAAAAAGSIEILNKLLDSRFQHSHNDYQAALNDAAEGGNWEITKVLLQKRANLSCDTVFYEAATRTDDLEVLEALWEYTEGNISSETLDHSLYETTDNMKMNTVQLLLEKFGADANARGEEYGNALTASAYDGTLDILKLLLDHGADVNSDDGWALQTAAVEGHVDIVKELLIRGADVNARTSNPNFPQRTALYGACDLGWDEIVDVLLEHGADANLSGGEDDYPILAAARNCESEIIKKLILAHADVNMVGGDDGSTALILSAKNSSELEPLERLIDAGAAIDATNNDGDTALIAAASMCDSEFVNFLLAKGADIMHINNDGKNAMQAASFKNNSKLTLEYLINYISFILVEIEKEIKGGNQSIVNAVENGRTKGRAKARVGARAEARARAEAKIAAGDKVQSSHESDIDAASTSLASRKDYFEDLHERHHSEHPLRRLFSETGSDHLQRTGSEHSVASESEGAPGLKYTHQVDGDRNAAPSDDKLHKETAVSDVLQPDSIQNNLHNLTSNEHRYPGSVAAVNSATYSRTDQMRNQVLFQKQENWRPQAAPIYNNYSAPNRNIPQQVSRVDQIENAIPQGSQGGLVRRKPIAPAKDEWDYSQNMARGGSPSSKAIPAPQQQHRHQYQPGENPMYDSNTQQLEASPPHNLPRQLQIFNQGSPAYAKQVQTQQPNPPALGTVSHPTQSRRLDTAYGESAHRKFEEPHAENRIVYDHSRYPAQPQNLFSQNDPRQHPRNLQSGQVYRSTAVIQEPQSENGRYHAMPLGPTTRFGVNSDRQRTISQEEEHHHQYGSPERPKPGLFDVKSTLSQAKGRFFR